MIIACKDTLTHVVSCIGADQQILQRDNQLLRTELGDTRLRVQQLVGARHRSNGLSLQSPS